MVSAKRTLIQQTFLLMGNYIGNVMVGLAATIIITRTLGPELRGVYAWLLTIHVIGVQVATLAPYNTVRQLGSTTPVAKWPVLAGTFAGLSAIGSVLTLPLFIWAAFQPAGQHYAWLLALGWFTVPIASLGSSLSGLVHLRGKPMDVLGPTMVARVSTTALALAAWAAKQISIGVALWLNLLTSTLALAAFCARLDIGFRRWRFDAALAKRTSHFLGTTWLSTMVLYVMPKTIFLILPHYSGMAELGFYSIASTLFDVSLFLPIAAGSVLVSHFAKSESGNAARWHALWALTGFLVLAAVAGYGISPYVVPLLFGKSFLASVAPFRILLLALVLQGPLTIYTSFLTARARGWAVLVPSLGGFVATTGAAFWLIPAHGMLGAAWAAVIGYGAQLLTTLPFCLKSRLK